MFQWFNRYSISNAFDPFNRFAPFIMATPVPTVQVESHSLSMLRRVANVLHARLRHRLRASRN